MVFYFGIRVNSTLERQHKNNRKTQNYLVLGTVVDLGVFVIALQTVFFALAARYTTVIGTTTAPGSTRWYGLATYRSTPETAQFSPEHRRRTERRFFFSPFSLSNGWRDSDQLPAGKCRDTGGPSDHGQHCETTDHRHPPPGESMWIQSTRTVQAPVGGARAPTTG